MIMKRVLPLAKTWLQLFPHFHIYTDYILDEEIEAITNSSSHINITIHSIPTTGHHLIGSPFDDEWNHAQTRHLIAIDDLYQQNPNKKWYFLGDDDTYIYPNNILTHLQSLDYTLPHVYGFLFLSFHDLEIFYLNNNSHYFAQGGAGIFISQAMMKIVGDNLLNCSKYYDTYNFASDMRLSACIEKTANDKNITLPGLYFFHCNDELHGDIPEKSSEKTSIANPTVTYHHVVPPMTYHLWNSSISIWKNDDVDVYVDWGSYSTSIFYSDISFCGNRAKIYWGYKIIFGSDDMDEPLLSLSQPEPIFGKNQSSIPIMYKQSFQKGITLKYICDESLSAVDILFDHFLVGEEEGTAFKVFCQKPSYFLHNKANVQHLAKNIDE